MRHLLYNRFAIATIAISIFALFSGASARCESFAYKQTASGTHTLKLETTSGNNFKVALDDNYITEEVGGVEVAKEYTAISQIYVSSGTLNVIFNTSATVLLDTPPASDYNIHTRGGSGSKTYLSLGDSYTCTGATLQRTEASKSRYVAYLENSSIFSISGKSDKYFVISGGCDMDIDFATHTATAKAGGVKASEALVQLATATISFEYVHFTDVWTTGSAGVFRASMGKTATTITNCKFSHCYSGVSGSLIYSTYTSSTGGTFKMDRCQIEECYCAAPGGTDGGIIRTTGSSLTHITLQDCTFINNQTMKAGTVTWYAGRVNPIIIDGCTFEHNWGSLGAAVNLESSAEITKCQFLNNECSQNGGAIYYAAYSTPYTLSAGFKPNNYTVTLDEDTSIYNNTAHGAGGAIYVNIRPVASRVGYSDQIIYLLNNEDKPIEISLNIKGAKVYNNHALCENTGSGDPNGGGAFYIRKALETPESYITDLNINYGDIYSNESKGNGGAFYVNGSVPVVVGTAGKTLKMYGNTAEGNGGCGYISEGNITFNGGELTDNTAKVDGGAIYVAAGNVSFSNGTVSSNHSDNNGGALWVKGSLSFNGGTIAENDSKNNGAGVYVSNGNVTVNGGKIESNVATVNGGGAFVTGGSLTLKNGTISSNEAVDGAGIWVDGTSTIDGGSVTGNIASGNGGGVLSSGSGGIVVKNGSISENKAAGNGAGIYALGSNGVNITKGSILKNTISSATGNGGGVYISGASFTMDGGTINANKAYDGAGVWSDGNVTFSNGQIQSNVASHNGGGLFSEGGVITFSNGSLTSNSAYDGGGIFLSDGAAMTYNNGGYLCSNTASHRGGGVHLASSADPSHPTSLVFSVSSSDDEMGLYSNIAEDEADDGGAGDDIYAEGGNTDVVVPDIKNMKLEGFSIPGAELKWYEDYAYKDSRYAEGTCKNTEASPEGRRYRKERDLLNPVYSVDDIAGTGSAYRKKYLALTMGFSLKTLTIRRKGLCPGEQAIYDIVGPDKDGVPFRQRVVIYGTDAIWDVVNLEMGSGGVRGLPAGDYTVTETSWAWYNKGDGVDGSITGPLTQKISESNGALFSFINTHPAETDTGTPMHDEKYKSNTLK